MIHKISFYFIISLILFSQCTSKKYNQPELGVRSVQILQVSGLQFKDLNKNGELDPYEDWRLPNDERIENLISLMTLEEKVAILFHTNVAVPPTGELDYDLAPSGPQGIPGVIGSAGQQLPGAAAGETSAQGEQQPAGGRIWSQIRDLATIKEYVEEKQFKCIVNNGVTEPDLFASWSNQMQEMAENTRLGIPIMFSTNPRHGAVLGAHVSGTQYFSQWPSMEGEYGIASTRDLDLAEEYGRVTAEEYRAVGLHMELGPQIDVTTDPRWGRNAGCYSESAELTADMLVAFMEGAQGESVGSDKILVHLKHYPGSGPQKGGQGDWLVYPGNNFDYHLIPWKAGIDKGALVVMGYYSGTYFDTLASNYSHYISTEVLYNQLGFKGTICTDWGVISRTGPLRPDLVDMPIKDRYEMVFNAGVDQIGGETDPSPVIELVKEGRLTEERINSAASKILRWHFLLGLFENPYVDPEAAKQIVRSEKNQALGYEAQLKSIILLDNDGTLPLEDNKPRLFISGIDPAIAGNYGTVVNNPGDADFAVVRVSSRSSSGGFATDEANEVNIDLPKATLDMIRDITKTGVPTIVAVNLNGSLVVLPKELLDISKGTLMIFDVVDNALLDVVFGRFNPVGKLPFELPSSMEAVRNQLEDVPFDSKDPLFEYGFGLSY